MRTGDAQHVAGPFKEMQQRVAEQQQPEVEHRYEARALDAGSDHTPFGRRGVSDGFAQLLQYRRVLQVETSA
jgi:hypothetical protein